MTAVNSNRLFMRAMKQMKEAEVIIYEKYCTGCGYCEIFCPKGCIAITGEKLSPAGYLLPVLRSEEECTGCGICAHMCPAFAIDVYRIKH